jgi:hypothetical protein
MLLKLKRARYRYIIEHQSLKVQHWVAQGCNTRYTVDYKILEAILDSSRPSNRFSPLHEKKNTAER